MAWDAARSQVVVFGGFSFARQNDTWTWDGSNWALQPSTLRPVAKYKLSLAYDQQRKELLCFGGDTNGKLDTETWAWDGKSWYQHKVTIAPPPRVSSAMAYDAARKQVVLFGGSMSTGALGDTWTWNGKAWSKQTPTTSPSARSLHTMAYDSRRGVVVLFGGYNGSQNPIQFSDTWLWDGKNWKREVTSKSPPARFSHAMTYDSKRHQLVLFGGRAGSTLRYNDTWLLHTTSRASTSKYGKGCGTFPGFRMDVATGSLPAFGETLTLDVLGLPASSTAAVVSMGLSRTKFGPLPLPLALAPLGMKGCTLLTSFDFQWIIQSKLGAGTFRLPIPHDTNLRGTKVYFQALGADHLATKLGLVTSNAVEATFGYR